MQETPFDPYDFTSRAMETLYTAAEACRFSGDDEGKRIYDQLKRNLNAVPFCDYLKRYLYRKAEPEGRMDDVPLNEYRAILCQSFEETGTPASFSPTTAKLSAMAKNWLTQKTVRRQVVLLLGFGLRMSAEEVDEFLTQAIREPRLNPKDPFEVLCWYCYRNGLGYPAFRRMQTEMSSARTVPAIPTGTDGDDTARRREKMESVETEAELAAYLAGLQDRKNGSVYGRTARRTFEDLYRKTCAVLAEQYNLTAEEEHAEELRRYRSILANNSRLYDYEKQERIRQKKEVRKRVTAEEITPGDVERNLYSSVPVDQNGNLLSVQHSSLGGCFDGKRLTRQRIGQIRSGAAVDRFDLLTLHFFLFSQEADEIGETSRRYAAFLRSANEMLRACSMGEMWTANPYECFLLVCACSDDPLGLFNDLWKLSYESGSPNLPL